MFSNIIKGLLSFSDPHPNIRIQHLKENCKTCIMKRTCHNREPLIIYLQSADIIPLIKRVMTLDAEIYSNVSTWHKFISNPWTLSMIKWMDLDAEIYSNVSTWHKFIYNPWTLSLIKHVMTLDTEIYSNVSTWHLLFTTPQTSNIIVSKIGCYLWLYL